MASMKTGVLATVASLIAVMLTKLSGTVGKIVDYLILLRKDKKEKERKNETKERNDKVKDVCDNGNLEDLINL